MDVCGALCSPFARKSHLKVNFRAILCCCAGYRPYIVRQSCTFGRRLLFYVLRLILKVGTFRAQYSKCHPRHFFTPEATAALCRPFARKNSPKSELLLVFSCKCALFVVPLRANLR